MATGKIRAVGVKHPEGVLEPLPFFDELKKRGMRIFVQKEVLL